MCSVRIFYISSLFGCQIPIEFPTLLIFQKIEAIIYISDNRYSKSSVLLIQKYNVTQISKEIDYNLFTYLIYVFTMHACVIDFA